MEMLITAGKKYMKVAKQIVDGQMYLLNAYVNKYTAMTPEDFVNHVFDNSIYLSKKFTATVKQLYEDREIKMKQTMNLIKKAYKNMEKKFNELKNIRTEEFLETLVHETIMEN